MSVDDSLRKQNAIGLDQVLDVRAKTTRQPILFETHRNKLEQTDHRRAKSGSTKHPKELALSQVQMAAKGRISNWLLSIQGHDRKQTGIR